MGDVKARITLVLGGARSGKSRFAEGLVEAHEGDLAYLATGQAWDAEMRDRIDQHTARRGNRWATVECPVDLAAAVDGLTSGTGACLIDCLTLWVTNLMMQESADFEAAFRRLTKALGQTAVPVVLVSNEVGLGIVPENKMAREFRDHAGRLHQIIAEAADEVYFVAAGLPLKMK